ncbi:AAA family ATPase [Sulfidibacter corallicola]|uniref:AAA family ATPase n=1 Tax=Sulfidibacter corallicola TaxID=2818388 RepID=A0A8A4TNT0_SULCO|nr:AAA family ATPase [Sulfidibacter corallicola]QTD50864.1 AAA family ATPase [Sulfidibacter corallicola]
MSEIIFPIHILQLRLEDNYYLAEPLFLPQFASVDEDPEKAVDHLCRLLEGALAKRPLYQACERHSAEAFLLDRVTVQVPPHKETRTWDAPIEVTFPVVRYASEQKNGARHHLARVPWLDLEIAVRHEQDGPETLRFEIAQALKRRGAARSLERLHAWSRVVDMELTQREVAVNFPTALQRHRDINEDQTTEVLRKVTTRLNHQRLPKAYRREAEVQRLCEALTRESRQGMLLVGKSGVGKTAVIQEMVRRRIQLGVGHLTFCESNGSRLVAGQTGFGMWQDQCQRLIGEAQREKAVLILGSLLELSEVGKACNIHQSIAGFLRPHIAGGNLPVICECTPEQYGLIEKRDPQLLQVFERIDIEEPDEAAMADILAERAKDLRKRYRSRFSTKALRRIDRLHRRFAAYSALPGRPLRFIDNLAMDRPDHDIEEPQVYEAFTRETGLPRLILDPSVPMSLDATRTFFQARVIGQEGAIDLVVDMLAAIKADLTQANRPIGSYLFIGPTGVGKTEMAKTIANWLFGDATRVTRFDMSEFSDPYSVQRLIGSKDKGAGLLTAKVREEPFSVLLFDEFEKADSLFFDLLLQILGDGRLTDDAGRVASFRNTIIVMTSNLGAKSFEKGRLGVVKSDDRESDANAHFLREVRDFLRPEIFNRIDRVVPFYALSPNHVTAITQLELDQLHHRDGIRQSGVTLSIDPSVVHHLAQAGYDAKLGARPLKRTLQARLIVPLSEILATRTLGEQHRVEISMADGFIRIAVTANRDVPEKPGIGPAQSQLLKKLSYLRRDLFELDRGPHLSKLRNEIERLKMLEQRLKKRKRGSPHEHAQIAKLPDLKTQAKGFDDLNHEVVGAESACHMAWYGYEEPNRPDMARLTRLNSGFFQVMAHLYAREFAVPDRAVVGVFGDTREITLEMVDIYCSVALTLGMQLSFETYHAKRPPVRKATSAREKTAQPKSKGSDRRLSPKERETAHKAAKATSPGDTETGEPDERETRKRQLEQRAMFTADLPELREVTDPGQLEGWRKRIPDHLLGIALAIEGPLAWLWFGAELGLHAWHGEPKVEAVVVTHQGRLADFTPPDGAEKRFGLKNCPPRRDYWSSRFRITDHFLKGKHRSGLPWPAAFQKVMSDFLEQSARRRLLS